MDQDQLPNRRLGLQAKLEEILGSSNVYFQPPDDSRMIYPCLVFEINGDDRKAADNLAYSWMPRYQVTFIRPGDPDSPVIQKLVELPLCSFSRHFSTSGLNHDVFVIYH